MKNSARCLYVQYGCGMSVAPQWINYDASPTLRLERIPLFGRLIAKNACRFPALVEYGDIVFGLPLREKSCQGVYCSHVLEHLALEDCRRALRNTLKILKPGGIFRLVVPDLDHAVRSYIADSSENAAHRFMSETHLGQRVRERTLKGFAKMVWGNSSHLWMWNQRAMMAELSRVGFVEIRRAVYGDSVDTMFGFAEDKERWINCLGIECKRPSDTVAVSMPHGSCGA